MTFQIFLEFGCLLSFFVLTEAFKFDFEGLVFLFLASDVVPSKLYAIFECLGCQRVGDFVELLAITTKITNFFEPLFD